MKRIATLLILLNAFTGVFCQTIVDIYNPILPDPPTITLCSGETATFGAIAANYNSLIWTTSGTGTFDNKYSLTPTYYTGNDAGHIVLKLTATGPAGTVSDSANLIVNKMPDIFCGHNGGFINSSQSYSVSNAYATNVDSLLWHIYPTDAGTLDNYTIINPVFTPNNGFSGTASLLLIGYNYCGTMMSTLDIQVLDAYIQITDTTLYSPKNTVITICRTIAHSDPNAVFTSTICNTPAHGAVGAPEISGNKVCVAYTPYTDYTGTEQLCIKVCDNAATSLCDDAIANITLTPYVNHRPVTADTSVSIQLNTPTTFSRTISDPDPNSAFTIIPLDGPIHGTSTSVISGSTITITYTPNNNYFGSDQFGVYYRDNGIPAYTDFSIVKVNIITANNNVPPVAYDDVFNVAKNHSISGNVIANDFDPDGNINPSGVILNSSPPGNGTFNLSSNGIFSFIPTTGYTGVVQFNYSICDTGSPAYSDAAIAKIIVNNAPIITDTIISSPKNKPIDICREIIGFDSALVYTTSVYVAPAHGTMTNPVITGNRLCVTYTPFVGYTGIDNPKLRICNNVTPVTCDISSIVLSITPVNINHPPVITDTIVSTTINNPITICRAITHPDPNSVFSAISTNPANGSVSLPVVTDYQVCITYTPDPGFIGSDPFFILVCDNGSPILCDSALIMMNVVPWDGLPVVDAGADTTIAFYKVFQISTSSASNYSTLFWTSSGTGLFNHSDILNPTYTPSTFDITNGSVFLTLTALNDNGAGSSQMKLSFIPPSELICSNVTAGENTNSPAYSTLFRETGNGIYSFQDNVVSILNHDFCFNYAPSANYIFYSEPDSALWNSFIPTYFGNTSNWENATSVNPGNGGMIDLLPVIFPGTGMDSIKGSITYSGDKYLPAGILNRIVVLLYNSNNEPVKWTKTNSNGYYSFSSLPDGNYFIKPTITGYSTNLQQVALSGTSTISVVNFVIHGYLITAVKNEENYISGLFPNPSSLNINVIITPDAPDIESYCIVDITGKILISKSTVSNMKRQLSISIKGLRNGVYVMRLQHTNGLICKKRFEVLR